MLPAGGGMENFMTHTYKTNGTCSTNIQFDLEDNIVKNISFTNGCNGNLQGISALAEGKTVEEIIEKCSGILCGRKNTSCPDQLARAVKKAYEEEH